MFATEAGGPRNCRICYKVLKGKGQGDSILCQKADYSEAIETVPDKDSDS